LLVAGCWLLVEIRNQQPATSNQQPPKAMHPTEALRARRERFLAELGPGSVAILPTSPVAPRSNDTEYRFRPDSDFYYLTGFAEPDAVAVFAPGHEEHKFVLFVPPRDPEMEVWYGRRAGVEGAVERFGADAAFSIKELDEKIFDYVDGRERLYFHLGRDERFDRRAIGWVNAYRTSRRAKGPGPATIVDPGEILHEMRLVKNDTDLELLRRAVDISVEGHRAAMAATRPGIMEYEIEALVEYTFRRRGAAGPGYTTIVGAGPNATILHYIENDCRVGDSDLVLLDAGAEYDCFTGDVTRTWPASGRFSEPQRDIYQLVLESQKAAIEMVRPGETTQAVHERVVEVLTTGMIDLGLLEGPADKAIEEGAYKKFYMHKTGHWLGMDVHDVGRYKVANEWRPMAPGIVQTIEPGLYIAEDCDSVAPHWRGIGVRIEDDVLVTESGYDVLSKGAPKEIAEIEEIVGTAAETAAAHGD
jgi:Xaa-Pro aminopeptidase